MLSSHLLMLGGHGGGAPQEEREFQSIVTNGFSVGN